MKLTYTTALLLGVIKAGDPTDADCAKDVFKTFSQGGKMSEEGFEIGYKFLSKNPTRQEGEGIWAKMDANKDNSLTEQEFVAVATESPGLCKTLGELAADKSTPLGQAWPLWEKNNTNDQMSKDQFKAAYISAGGDDEQEGLMMFTLADQDGSGSLSGYEFFGLAAVISAGGVDFKSPEAIFSAFAKGSEMTKAEFTRGYKALDSTASDAQINADFARGDTSGNGTLDLAEFKKLLEPVKELPATIPDMAQIGINPDTTTYTAKQKALVIEAFEALAKEGRDPTADEIKDFQTKFATAGANNNPELAGIPLYIPEMAEIGVNPDLTQWNNAQIAELKKVAAELNGQDPTPAQAAAFRSAWDKAETKTGAQKYTPKVTVAQVTDGTAKAKISAAPKTTMKAASVTAVTSSATTSTGGLAGNVAAKAGKAPGGGGGGNTPAPAPAPAAAAEDAESKAAGFAASVAMVMALSTVAGI